MFTSAPLSTAFWHTPEIPTWFAGCRRVLVGVSGGADSMALLWLLAGADDRPDWAPQVVVAHVNHQMRGAESDADQGAVEELAERLGVPFHCKTLDAEKLKSTANGSLEESMREARYTVFRSILGRTRCQALVLAHHQNDLAETFLMRLLRGSGLTGLGAFGPVADIYGMRVIRPLIGWSRDDLRKIAKQEKLPWREDASNASDTFFRNRIRRTALPCLERVAGQHGSASATLARTARRLEREQAALNAFIRLQYQQSRQEKTEPRRIGIPREIVVSNDGVFATHLLRHWWADLLPGERPPSEDRILELENFVRIAEPGALMQTAKNVVVWMGPNAILWGYQKPERRIAREALLETFVAN
ncbi:TPA: tRNA lysidine(34) synthetase TilS [Candidatus Sumerlaeota bacterium]|nr:tRNA lysidine(34) synthetase TilS [Candidatus Sumerlaeota bacterium]